MAAETVLIYRDTMLGPSETFILAQAESLPEFRPFYVGAREIPGIEVPRDRRFLINDGTRRGRAREILFKVFGWVSARQVAVLARKQPRLIHAHFGTDGLLALPLARALRVP